MVDYSHELKIPLSRVAVLIGKHGETKKKIEKETQTKIEVDSREGDLFISGEDALAIYTVKEIVTAIGRGFNPEIALLLLRSDYSFEQINLNDAAKTKNHLIRIKGRLIRENGKSRELIEQLTECSISVFGKTVSIIGRNENSSAARRAVEKLISGSQHSAVYRMLEKNRARLKSQRFLEKSDFFG